MPLILSSRRAARIAPLALALAVSNAYGVDVIGRAGTPGVNGATYGAAGTAGGNGESIVTSGAADAPAQNAIGGAGGNGGNGGNPSVPNGIKGGAAGAGGAGGKASAGKSGSVSLDTLRDALSAQGGRGGNAGLPGAPDYPGQAGATAARGRGGDAEALYNVSVGRDLAATVTATGGAAGKGLGYNTAAQGGNAKVVATTNALERTSNTASAKGGEGASVDYFSNVWGGAGTAGGAASVAMSATSRDVTLDGTAVGGKGGNASGSGSNGGDGGSASGTLGANAASKLKATLSLTGGKGGAGGDRGAGGSGGSASSDQSLTLATTGTVDVSVSARGGDGGYAKNGRAGVGGTASSTLILAARQASAVSAGVYAKGGAGGNHDSTGASRPVTAGRGGDATGVSAANIDTALASEIRAGAAGGAGGDASGAGSTGGIGGTAQASAALHNAGSGDVTVTVSATGGKGGKAPDDARDGDGGAALLVNAASGSTSGKLTLVQNATGGDGGGEVWYNEASTGNGGNALSRLTVRDSRASTLTATVSTLGGYGARVGASEAVLELASTVTGAAVSGTSTAETGYARQNAVDAPAVVARSVVQSAGSGVSKAVAKSTGAEGIATSNVDAHARAISANAANASANASSGRFSPSVARGRAEAESAAGPANAHAVVLGYEVHSVASTRSVGTAANVAKADAEGLRGTAIAQSTATGNGVLVSTGVSATVAGDTQARTQVNAGGAAYELVRPVSSTSGGRSYASVLPDAASVAALLAKDPQVAAALADDQVIGAGTMQASRALALTYGTDTYVTTANFQFDTTGERYLTLGLLGSLDQGSGLRQLALSVSNHGTALFSQTFASLADARLFFDDHALSLGLLGAGSQDLLVSAGFTYTGPGGFAFQYALGVSAVPEAQTWMMVLLGASVLIFRRKGNAA